MGMAVAMYRIVTISRVPLWTGGDKDLGLMCSAELPHPPETETQIVSALVAARLRLSSYRGSRLS